MSEVKRYHVTDAGLVEGQALGRINVVLGPDYDSAVQCFLTAAEGCVAAERRERALQALLTAADERADVLVTALSKIKLRLDAFVEADRDMPSPSVEVCQSIAYAALKPAKMLPADHKCIECESEYCHGVCVERGDSDDRLIE